MSLVYITPHFSWEEAACHDGNDVPDELKPNARRLAADVLERIRERWNKPIIVVSWWRSVQWNFKCGGAPLSKHLTAEAADIRPVSLGDLPRFRAVIEDMLSRDELPALGALGWYPRRWVHVDVRPRLSSGMVTRWEGKGVGSEVA